MQREKTQDSIHLLVNSDMVESFDDGIAFMMLLGTPNVHVKGLTTATTNVWAQEALAYGIRLGELCKGQDTIYVAGSQYPLRQGRLDSMNNEIDRAPGNDASWRGAISYPEANDWKACYIGKYGRQPEIQPASVDAADFIARQILNHPGQITILAIGACTNLAKALIAHPEIAPMTREIIYMGGAVFCPGNTTSYAEMNFLYDPEAAAICLRAPFPKQTLVSLDVCNTVQMTYQRFLNIYHSIQSREIKELVRRNYPYADFQAAPASNQMVWDLVSAAIAVDPTIITEYAEERLDIDDISSSPTYGKSFVTDQTCRQRIKIPLKINQERFWNIITDGISRW